MNNGAPLFAVGPGWAIASPHRAATEIGEKIFREGGNAIDAAIAAAAVLTVVYPHQCSIGGDLFAIARVPNGHLIAVNGSGAAAAAASVEEISAAHRTMPIYGPLTVTVPGAVAGWESLAGLGNRLDWAKLIEPAIELARASVPVTPSLARALDGDTDRLRADAGMSEVFFSHGVPDEGTTVRQPNLARSLASIATDGASALYGGRVGATLAEGLRALGSPLTIDDLTGHTTEITSPLRATYRRWDVATTPPNSQGFVLLQILTAIEALEIDPDPLGPDAAKIASIYSNSVEDRARCLADPRFVDLPLDELLDVDHCRALLREPRTAAAPGPVPAGDTVALVTADADGFAVSLIQSLWHGFGSGILEPATGIVCQNRGASFSLDPSHPNVIAGTKRPAHTLMPVVISDGRNLAVVAGTMGGRAQPQIHAQVLPRILEGSPLGDAIDRPRLIVGGLEEGPGAGAIFVEGRATLPGEINAPLHRLAERDEEAGHYAAIRVGTNGSFEAASDPRSDGAAAAGGAPHPESGEPKGQSARRRK